ncbi:hypothetical protein JW992_01100 [candidate division KSB1 bacterium]|nr:hypothetical protein [candidate division KSB1 bacterium]
MSTHYHDLFPELQARLNDFVCETPQDTEQFFGLPHPYVATEKNGAQLYAHTFFTNLGLLRLKQIDLARFGVENLVSLLPKLGYVPASNRKDMSDHSHLPFLPWMVRDIYRATGDKEWLRRVLPEVIHEYQYWTDENHRSPSGLYRFGTGQSSPDQAIHLAMHESLWVDSPRFRRSSEIDPIDLNALLYRNALLIHDLQKEADGHGDPVWLNRAEKLKQSIEKCWNEEEGLYLDHNYGEKSHSPIKSLAGFMPLFVEMIDADRAERLVQNISRFVHPGGLACTDQDYGFPACTWNYPLGYAPLVYLILKGMMDYDFLEDAADIGNSWLDMVAEIYSKTGEVWEWYNVTNRSIDTPAGIKNQPVWGWTAGPFIAIADELGLV